MDRATFGTGPRQRGYLFFHQEGDQIARNRVFRDRHTAGLAPVGQRAAPANVQRGLHLRQREMRAIPLEGRTGIGRALRAALLLERGIPGAALEEVVKRALQMPQRLLQRDAGDFLQPGHLFLLLQARQQDGQVLLVEGFLALIAGIRPGAQASVVDVAHTPKGARQGLSLGWRRIDAVLGGALLLHSYIVSHDVTGQQRSRGASIPSPKGRGLTRPPDKDGSTSSVITPDGPLAEEAPAHRSGSGTPEAHRSLAAMPVRGHMISSRSEE